MPYDHFDDWYEDEDEDDWDEFATYDGWPLYLNEFDEDEIPDNLPDCPQCLDAPWGYQCPECGRTVGEGFSPEEWIPF